MGCSTGGGVRNDFLGDALLDLPGSFLGGGCALSTVLLCKQVIFCHYFPLAVWSFRYL